MDDKYESTKLSYTIHKYSSYTANYLPENILVNHPSDQLSRWFTDSTTPSQFITLKLKSPAIVETIKFGKYIKAHVSDLKKFQVFGGIEENNLSLLLTAGLKKDSVPEVFRLRHRTSEGLYLPVRYIKIVPLQSWGPAYNYTIWYVEMQGKDQKELIKSAADTINLRKEEEAVRILLKHLRRRRYKDAFEALSRESGVQLEGPVQARLWNALVENGDYQLSEQIFEDAANAGELEWYMSWQPYTPEWRQLCGCSAAVEERLSCGELTGPPLPERPPCADPSPAVAPRAPDLSCADRGPRLEMPEVTQNGAEGLETCYSFGSGGARPGPRGGHQLVVDPNTGTLFLFGGWNGTEDLDDLWSFDPCTEQWALLCPHSEAVGGPSPRSCHKMVFDPVHEKLYTLGRYLDNAQRVPSNMNSDLYMYSVRTRSWSRLCGDTAAEGGPRLVFDHQMCLDAHAQTIYVFGGRVLPANTEELASPQYSGLFAYYIARGTWQRLAGDADAPQPRVSHSMLFHPNQRRLYMFAGQRNKEQLVDLWWWDVGDARDAGDAGGAGGRAHAVCRGAARAPPPQGFTQRATLDPDTDEIHVLSGMSKERDKRVSNTLWVFSLRRLTWSCVYRNESPGLYPSAPVSPPGPAPPAEPLPRFAHQLVYDPNRKIHYLFGGNPGCPSCPRLRLDDLWSLKLKRASCERVRRIARAALREARYRELAAVPDCAAEALHFLRNDLRAVTDHNDPSQVEHFQRLATLLFTGGAGEGAGGCEGRACAALSPARARTLARRRAGRPPQPQNLANALAAVLGSEDVQLEPTQPFEENPPPAPDTWEAGEQDDAPDTTDATDTMRAARIRLYDQLCQYFRPSTVPPKADVADLVHL